MEEGIKGKRRGSGLLVGRGKRRGQREGGGVEFEVVIWGLLLILPGWVEWEGGPVGEKGSLHHTRCLETVNQQSRRGDPCAVHSILAFCVGGSA